MAAAAPDALPPADPVPPLPRAIVDSDPPVGRPTDVGPRPRAAARVATPETPPAPVAGDVAENDQVAAVAPEEAEPPAPQVDARATEPAPVPEPPAAEPAEYLLPRPPPGAPRIVVSFLVYSRSAERRTVALTVSGGSMVTLHEGEKESGIEIARILPDRIHVRYDGRMFSVMARDL
jgi:hypothetical protein